MSWCVLIKLEVQTWETSLTRTGHFLVVFLSNNRSQDLGFKTPRAYRSKWNAWCLVLTWKLAATSAYGKPRVIPPKAKKNPSDYNPFSIPSAHCSCSSFSGWWLGHPSEKKKSQLGWLFPIYGKIRNVPNHRPVLCSPAIHVCKFQHCPIASRLHPLLVSIAMGVPQNRWFISWKIPLKYTKMDDN